MTASVSNARVMAMPGCDALKCGTGAKEGRLAQIGGDELECDRQTFLAEAARQRDRWVARHVERAGIFLQLGYEPGLLAQCPDRGEGQWRERMHWREQQVYGAEQC